MVPWGYIISGRDRKGNKKAEPEEGGRPLVLMGTSRKHLPKGNRIEYTVFKNGVSHDFADLIEQPSENAEQPGLRTQQPRRYGGSGTTAGQRTFTVLDLDGHGLESMLPKQVGIATVEIKGGVIEDPYHNSFFEQVKIRGIIEKGGIDYIVIGNNVGKGLERALVVPKSMRERSCVIWDIRRQTHLGGELKDEYEKLGFRYHVKIGDLREFIRATILTRES